MAKLMPALEFSNQEAWQGFLSSLEESDQGHIAWRLRVTECVYEVYQQIKPAQLENCEYQCLSVLIYHHLRCHYIIVNILAMRMK